MKRVLQAEETRLWAVVAATVRPRPGRAAPVPPPEPPTPQAPTAVLSTAALAAHLTPAKIRASPTSPEIIEPTRKRRIARGREVIEARLDLHGLDQTRARARLLDFLLDAQARGARAVLVITGKGYAGEGVLRRRTPEWLSDPNLKGVVAGLSPAENHHGGEGAFYIALKRPHR